MKLVNFESNGMPFYINPEMVIALVPVVNFTGDDATKIYMSGSDDFIADEQVDLVNKRLKTKPII